ncbi:MAG: HD domain-containing protein [Treponema sp.]|jgi:poly(A) polymerase|nr:HD domain-containing protein [Treponema sp.]
MGLENKSEGRLIESLLRERFQVRFCSFSALDNYLNLAPLPYIFLETNADIARLAHLAEELHFPGADLADGAADSGGKRFYFRCRDNLDSYNTPNYGTPPAYSYKILSLVQNAGNCHFQDMLGIYPVIRYIKDTAKDAARNNGQNPETGTACWWESICPGTNHFQALTDAALILARYQALDYPSRDFIEALSLCIENKTPPGKEAQQVLLIGLMVSSRPDRGLELLKACGFLQKFWPEIARLDNVDHSKEFHPEGNAWKHTLMTFEHRKQNTNGEYDLRLSLALLLHDIGKPLSEVSGNKRFDGHAELGAREACRFLERLDFDSALVDDVFYLVKNHMLPAALARLSFMKTGEVMKSPLFPSLMELYRCDESSSFKGLEGYYENSAAYQNYLRNMKNPFRGADGKKFANHKRKSYHK